MIKLDDNMNALRERARKVLAEMSQDEINETNRGDFLALFQKLWERISKVPFSPKDNSSLFKHVLDICVKGWNAAILHWDEKDACKFFADEYGKDSLDYMVALNMYRQKQALFLFDQLIIKDVKAQDNKGNPVYDFAFDVSALEDFLEGNGPQ